MSERTETDVPCPAALGHCMGAGIEDCTPPACYADCWRAWRLEREVNGDGEEVPA